MRTKLMTLSMSPTNKFRETINTAFVNPIEEESRSGAMLGECLKNFCRIDIRSIVKGKGDYSWDDAMREDCSNWHRRRMPLGDVQRSSQLVRRGLMGYR